MMAEPSLWIAGSPAPSRFMPRTPFPNPSITTRPTSARAIRRARPARPSTRATSASSTDRLPSTFAIGSPHFSWWMCPRRWRQLRVARAVLGGWSISGIATLQSGSPFTVVTGGQDTSGFNQSTAGNSPNGGNRPNLVLRVAPSRKTMAIPTRPSTHPGSPPIWPDRTACPAATSITGPGFKTTICRLHGAWHCLDGFAKRAAYRRARISSISSTTRISPAPLPISAMPLLAASPKPSARR